MMKKAIVLVAAMIFAAIAWPVIADETVGQNQTLEEQASPIMQEMLDRMHAMRQQMAKIHEAEDIDERHRLTHEHMQSMRDALMMMDMMGQSLLQHSTDVGDCMDI
jgi:cell fate (sporulation/competence/biofilm development) regulator YmcA (YheA/YmcA/DUF963 family)